MLLEKERENIIAHGIQMIRSGLTTGSGGNISIYNREENLIAITPSGLSYETMTPSDIVLISPDGTIVSGERVPSSESTFHTALYRHRSDISAIVHTHSVYATTFACLDMEIPAVHYLVGFSGNKVPVAPYATYGTKTLSDNILRHIGTYNAILLSHHGLVAVGSLLSKAFNVAEEIELVARIYYQSLTIKKPDILSDEEMNRVIDKFNRSDYQNTQA